eukprot:2968221-Pyramimonas_sp.AAC.1
MTSSIARVGRINITGITSDVIPSRLTPIQLRPALMCVHGVRSLAGAFAAVFLPLKCGHVWWQWQLKPWHICCNPVCVVAGG